MCGSVSQAISVHTDVHAYLVGPMDVYGTSALIGIVNPSYSCLRRVIRFCCVAQVASLMGHLLKNKRRLRGAIPHKGLILVNGVGKAQWVADVINQLQVWARRMLSTSMV